MMPRITLLTAALLTATLSAVGSFAQDADEEASEVEALRAEIETLRGMIGSQSHTMMDVDYHFANLWFAGEAENWSLAQFYLNETVSHIGWAIRVRPVRPTSNGPLELQPIFETMRNFSLAEEKAAIEAQDKAAFEAAYAHVIDECHACHVAAEKPYLRPRIPEAPATRMIDMRPSAERAPATDEEPRR
jgi:hypothetical protein